MEGRWSATNFQNRAIALEITTILSGAVQSMSPDAQVERLAAGLRQKNPRTQLTWTLDLAPGAQQTVTNTYQICVRP